MKSIVSLSALFLASVLSFGQIAGLQFNNNVGQGQLVPVIAEEQTGIMSPIPGMASGATFLSGNSTIDPSNLKFYYSYGSNSVLAEVDLVSGTMALRNMNNPNNADTRITCMQYYPADGMIYGLNMKNSQLRLAKLNPATGAVSLVSQTPISADQFSSGDATLDAVNGIFYYIRGSASKQLIRVDIQTGTSTSVGVNNPNQAISPIVNIQWNPTDSMIYGLNFTQGQLRMAKLDPSTGAVTIISQTPTSADAFSSGTATIDPQTGRYFYVRGHPNSQQIITVNMQNGAVIDNPGLIVSSGLKNLVNIEFLNPTVPVARFTADTECGNNRVKFYSSSLANQHYWFFGDGTGSTAANPAHIYPGPGTYQVTHVAQTSTGTDTTIAQVVVNPGFTLALGNDFSLFPGDSAVLDATTSGATSYQWSTGSTTPTLTITQAGVYSCTVSNGSCTASDDIEVTPAVAFSVDDTTQTNVTVLPSEQNPEAVIWMTNHEATSQTFFYELDMELPAGWEMEPLCSGDMQKAIASRVRLDALGFGGFHVVCNTNGFPGQATGTFKLINSSNTVVLREVQIFISNQTTGVEKINNQITPMYPNPIVRGNTFFMGDSPLPYQLFSLTGELIESGINTTLQAPNVSGVYLLKTPESQQRIVVAP